jgi:hypothetical protein
MIMKVRLMTILLLAAVSLLSACSNKQSSSERVSQQDRRAAYGRLHSEASEESDKYWETQVFSKCGDSFFTTNNASRTIYQVKGELISVAMPETDMKITEADKMNGVEWKGNSHASIKGTHRYYTDGKWSEWVDGSPIPTTALNISARKVRGVWEFGKVSGGYSNRDVFMAVSCSEVEKLTMPQHQY